MRTIKMGTSLTLILSDGTVITESNCTKEILDFVDKNADKEDAIKSFFLQTPEVAQEILETVSLVKDLKSSKSKLFKFDADTGITTIPSISNVSVPKHVIQMIQDAITAGGETNNEVLEGYLNFWKLCCRNPNEHSRNNTLWFLKQHGFTILKSGLFVAYRNVLEIDKGRKDVVKVDHSKEIKDLFKKVKTVYKKSPKTQMVIKLAGGGLITRKLGSKVAKDEENLGILHDLNNMATEEKLNTTKFTDKHTKTFDIRLGKPISMPRDKCDSNPNNSCSRGLHVACKDWSGLKDFGNTTIAVLVNPVDVVAVPTDAGYSKMRVCQYYPLKVVEWDGKKIIEDIKNGDELDYWDVIIDGKVNNKDSKPFALEVPELPKLEYTSYIKDITAIRDKMKSKLVK